MGAEQYLHLTYDLTIAVARQLSPGNPRIRLQDRAAADAIFSRTSTNM
jgi:hypothetical protein